jgi:undecaprenyl-diphosphatase
MQLLTGRALARYAVVLVALLLFGVLAQQVLTDGPLARVDRELMRWLVAHRSDAMTHAMLFLSTLHQTRFVLAACALLAAWFAWRRQLGWITTICAVPLGMLLNVGLKHTFQRARPGSDQALVHLATFSFPSGHAIAATLFYGVLCALLFAHVRSPAARVLGAAACLLVIAAVGFSRMYLAAHFLSDVLAGICVGTAWLLLWTEATARLIRARSLR